MKFCLIDRVEQFEPGKSLVGVKAVSLAEEYLADHFPTFPVLPGVMMLEALTQASAWLVRISQNFSHSVILLKSAKNVRYKSFVSPGQLLRVHTEVRSLDVDTSEFSASGSVDGAEVLNARIALVHRNMADRSASLAGLDQSLIQHFRRAWGLIYTAPFAAGLPAGPAPAAV